MHTDTLAERKSDATGADTEFESGPILGRFGEEPDDGLDNGDPAG